MGFDKRKIERVITLLGTLGIEPNSFLDTLDWALSEQLIHYLSQDRNKINSMISQPNGFKLFRNDLIHITRRKWSIADLNSIFYAVKQNCETQYRKPIQYGDYLKLLWTAEHVCAKCNKAPPDVILHIDHIIPASLGGSSKRENLQFLCAEHNLQKSNKLEEGRTWLDLK